jgi:hypothetical protein
MSHSEKEILLALHKYAEMLNVHRAESLRRLKILEEVMLKHPQLFPTFRQAARDTKQTELPGLDAE